MLQETSKALQMIKLEDRPVEGKLFFPIFDNMIVTNVNTMSVFPYKNFI